MLASGLSFVRARINLTIQASVTTQIEFRTRRASESWVVARLAVSYREGNNRRR